MERIASEGDRPVIAIVGGGASGLVAAIAAAQTWRAMEHERLREAQAGGQEPERIPAPEILVLEKDERVGRSILATGNGRCNFFNARPSEGNYRSPKLVEEAFWAIELHRRSIPCMEKGDSAIENFFGSLGLCWKEDEEGRCWPITNKASTVLDLLRAGCAANGVHEHCNCQVERIERTSDSGRFALHISDGRIVHADAAVVATGGGLGTRLLPPEVATAPFQPLLCPLAVEENWVRSLENIRVRAEVHLERDGQVVKSQRGEVQFRKFGVSGIAVFNLSRDARVKDTLVLDLLPTLRECDAVPFLNRRLKVMRSALGRTPTVGETLSGAVLPRIGEIVADQAGLDIRHPVQKGDTALLVPALKNIRLTVKNTAGNVSHQIMRGGIAADQLDPRTMQLACAPGLFAAGEAVDVDADCGGHNLRWAWTSGYLAGAAAARMAAAQGVEFCDYYLQSENQRRVEETASTRHKLAPKA